MSAASSSRITVEQPKYSDGIKFSSTPQEHMDHVHGQMRQHNMIPVSDTNTSSSAPRYKYIHVIIQSYNIEWDIPFIDSVTWQEMNGEITSTIKAHATNPHDVIGCALSGIPLWLPHGINSKVVDNRVDAQKTPFEVFPDGAVVFVVMLHRRSQGWVPMMVGLRACKNCGTVESNTKKLMKCARCDTHYCNVACQTQHWPTHKLCCKSSKK